MTNKDVLLWIKANLGGVINQALNEARTKTAALLYTEDWMAAIACRETGQLIAKRLYANPGLASGEQLARIAPLMTGDYSQRPGETEKTYHGFGFWQADIASFPQFVKSGQWKDPAKACAKAIEILEGKRLWLLEHVSDFKGYRIDKCITAAYNCGEGNVRAVIEEGHDVDIRTTDKNYSANVWEFRALYKTL